MTPLLDQNVLAELEELSPEDPKGFIRELFESYQKRAVVEVQEIEIFCSQNDWVELAKRAHSLKSAANQIGATKVGALGHEIETLIRSHAELERLPELVKDLKEAYHSSEALLLAYLG
jgi:HPt (histidine-containing phosphotransfer) domain-containing protein